MKKINLMLRKCKTLSRQLGRSSSYSSLRSKSTREGGVSWGDDQEQQEDYSTIFVGSTRKRYVISSSYLTHPLVTALLEKTPDMLLIKCEVVLFDHLLWMLQSADANLGFESFEELAHLYLSFNLEQSTSV